MLEVPEDELAAILSSDQILIVRFMQQGDSSHLNLDVKGYNQGDDYITSSHVWADGLRNPSGNALPYCQANKLRIVLLYELVFGLILCVSL